MRHFFEPFSALDHCLIIISSAVYIHLRILWVTTPFFPVRFLHTSRAFEALFIVFFSHFFHRSLVSKTCPGYITSVFHYTIFLFKGNQVGYGGGLSSVSSFATICFDFSVAIMPFLLSSTKVVVVTRLQKSEEASMPGRRWVREGGCPFSSMLDWWGAVMLSTWMTFYPLLFQSKHQWLRHVDRSQIFVSRMAHTTCLYHCDLY